MLFLKIGFSFVSAAVACAVLERISGFEPSSEIQGTFEVCYDTVHLLDLPLDAIGTVCHQFGLRSTDSIL